MQDLNDKVTGNSLLATEWNQVPSEIQNAIEALGVTLSSGDLNQLGKSLAGYAAEGAEYSDSGAANAYVLSATGTKQAIPSYRDGMRIRFMPANANTGASTVNVAGLGVVNIKLRGGTTDPSAGDIDPNLPCHLVYRTSPSAHFELDRSGFVKTVFQISSITYNPPVDVRTLEFIAVGGGGGGGGADGQGAGTAACGGGGAGGGNTSVLTTQIESSYTITIGAGGTGGTGTAGGNGAPGGDTTVVSGAISLTAPGGGGGSGAVGTSGFNNATAGASSLGTGGTIIGRGADGLAGIVVTAFPASAGNSGGSVLGGGRRGSVNGVGANGANRGEGGSGAGSREVTTDRDGGDGLGGAVIIREYF